MFGNNKQRKSRATSGNRLLITINVLGSTGPIRFLANEEDLVASVIDAALKSYAREERLPVLGSDLNGFILCCPFSGTEALSPWDTIGSTGFRSFMLCKKPQAVDNAIYDDDDEETHRKGSVVGSWRAWLHRSHFSILYFVFFRCLRFS